jgi:Na+-transporting methylmalonyl-CoA/oxaloacetate decarboxylase gamma subunit
MVMVVLLLLLLVVVMVVVSEDAYDAVKKNVVTPVGSVINKTWVVVSASPPLMLLQSSCRDV